MKIRTKLMISFALILILPTISIGMISYQTAKNEIHEQLLMSATTATGNVTVIPSKQTDDGAGVVGGNINLAYLAELNNQIRIGEEGYSFIVDRNQKYLAHPTIPAGDTNTESYIDYIYEHDSGRFTYEYQGSTAFTRIIVVNHQEEPVGIIVDQIAKVTTFSNIQPPPTQFHGLNGVNFTGIGISDDAIVGILDLHRVLLKEGKDMKQQG